MLGERSPPYPKTSHPPPLPAHLQLAHHLWGVDQPVDRAHQRRERAVPAAAAAVAAAAAAAASCCGGGGLRQPRRGRGGGVYQAGHLLVHPLLRGGARGDEGGGGTCCCELVWARLRTRTCSARDGSLGGTAGAPACPLSPSPLYLQVGGRRQVHRALLPSPPAPHPPSLPPLSPALPSPPSPPSPLPHLQVQVHRTLPLLGAA